jgi:hypothetical protein
MDAEEIIDRLYALPLGEFTRNRNQAERELRKAGQREQAEQVRALRKPTAAAAAPPGPRSAPRNPARATVADFSG